MQGAQVFCRHVAQGLEHHLDMVGVGGSIPLVPTKIIEGMCIHASGCDIARWDSKAL